MASIRYRILDLPTIGASAFTPIASMPPSSSSWGLVHVSGSPGTKPIPVKNPTEVWAPPISADRHTQASNCAPNVILPAIYIASTKNMGPSQHVGMAMRRRNPLPVPAINTVRVTKSAFHGASVGGRTEKTKWPRAFQRFTKGQTSNG